MTDKNLAEKFKIFFKRTSRSDSPSRLSMPPANVDRTNDQKDSDSTQQNTDTEVEEKPSSSDQYNPINNVYQPKTMQETSFQTVFDLVGPHYQKTAATVNTTFLRPTNLRFHFKKGPSEFAVNQGASTSGARQQHHRDMTLKFRIQCTHCGGTNHSSKNCLHEAARCTYCSQYGHIASICPKKHEQDKYFAREEDISESESDTDTENSKSMLVQDKQKSSINYKANNSHNQKH